MSTPTPTPVVETLERLAREAPTRLPDADRLWSQGRRRQRARWAGTAACLVLLAVLGAVAVPAAVQRTQGLVAVSPDAALRLPDVIRQPGEWEPAFPSAPGRLVAAGTGTRAGWRGSGTALWGVSAASGESRFLDLPDVAGGPGVSPALSADGRWLAYWVTDEDAAALPGTTDPEASTTGGPVGIAVVDLDTGGVERWESEAPHALSIEAIAWSGDVLWWKAATVESIGEDRTQYRYQTHVWEMRNDLPRVLEGGTPAWNVALQETGPAPGGLVVDDHRVLHVVRGDHVARTIRLDTQIGTGYGGPALSPDGARLAAVLTLERDYDADNADRTPVVVSSVDGRRTDFTRVGGVTSTAVLGWRSAEEVVIQTGRDPHGVRGVSVVRVDTGEVAPLVDLRDLDELPSFAADAWAAEVIEAPDAPWAPDPRLVGLGLLVVGAFVVSLARSLRRRRDGA